MLDLLREVFAEAETAGADFLLVGCPFCQTALDIWQHEVGGLRRRALAMPVLYLSELVGYALEVSGMDWCGGRHVNTVDRLVLEAGVVELEETKLEETEGLKLNSFKVRSSYLYSVLAASGAEQATGG